MTSCKIFYSPKSIRDIKKLDPVTKKKIGKQIERFLTDPLKYAHKTTSPKAGQYRWRAGNYRVIFDVSGRIIYILRIGHRREIYKR